MLSQCTDSTTLVHDSKVSVTAGFLEILENQHFRNVPPPVLLPVTVDSGVSAVGGRRVRQGKNFLER